MSFASQLSKTSAVALAHRLAGARDLERDRCDRAGIGVPGIAHGVGRAFEEPPRGGDRVGARLVEEVDELSEHLARTI